MNSMELFTKTHPLKLFFLASLPGAASMFASALYYTLDGIFVGHFLGETAFAALNLAMPFVIINFSLADLIGVGSAIPISISLGKKQKGEADNLFTCACIMIIAAGVLIGAALFAAAPLLIRLMGAKGDFADLAVQYLRVLRSLFPGDNDHFRSGQFPAHLRIYTRQSVCQSPDVRIERRTGVCLPRNISLGYMGGSARHMLRHVRLHCDRLSSVFKRKGRAQILPAAFYCQPYPSDHLLRRPEFFKQYRRQDHFYINEYHPGPIRISIGCVRVRHPHVCRRTYPTSSLRNVRFTPTGSGIQLGSAEVFPGARHRKMLFYSKRYPVSFISAGYSPFSGAGDQAVYIRSRQRCPCHVRHSAPAFQPDLHYTMVFFCHSKLYACHRETSARVSDFCIYGACFSRDTDRSALVSRAHRDLAQFRRDIRPCRRAVSRHPFPAAEGAFAG